METYVRPIARKSRLSRRAPKYPFATIMVGAMFFIPDKEPRQFHATSSRQGRALGRKFTVRGMFARDSLEGWVECGQGALGATWGAGIWRVS